MLKLSSSLVFSNTIKAGVIASSFPQQKQNALIAGWGYTTLNGPSSDLLRYGYVTVKPNNFVVNLLGGLFSLLGVNKQASTLFYTENDAITICFVSK